MKCPACGSELVEVEVGGVKVDVCKEGCGGMWFDNFELKKFDEPHEEDGEELLNMTTDVRADIDRSKRYNCPKCGDIVMMRHFFSVKKEVEIDECPGCGGIWLDAGELGRIRSLFNTEQERHQAADEYFNEIFGDQLKSVKSADESKSRRFANMFRFICPSYYIPGKQDWGAF